MLRVTDAFQMPPSLSRNRPHVFPNHLAVPGLRIATVGPNHEHVAGAAEREDGLVPEPDINGSRPVFDGMADVIHNLPRTLDTSYAAPPDPFSSTWQILSFLGSDRGIGVLPTHATFGPGRRNSGQSQPGSTAAGSKISVLMLDYPVEKLLARPGSRVFGVPGSLSKCADASMEAN